VHLFSFVKRKNATKVSQHFQDGGSVINLGMIRDAFDSPPCSVDLWVNAFAHKRPKSQKYSEIMTNNN